MCFLSYMHWKSKCVKLLRRKVFFFSFTIPVSVTSVDVASYLLDRHDECPKNNLHTYILKQGQEATWQYSRFTSLWQTKLLCIKWQKVYLSVPNHAVYCIYTQTGVPHVSPPPARPLVTLPDLWRGSRVLSSPRAPVTEKRAGNFVNRFLCSWHSSVCKSMSARTHNRALSHFSVSLRDRIQQNKQHSSPTTSSVEARARRDSWGELTARSIDDSGSLQSVIQPGVRNNYLRRHLEKLAGEKVEERHFSALLYTCAILLCVWDSCLSSHVCV